MRKISHRKKVKKRSQDELKVKIPAEIQRGFKMALRARGNAYAPYSKFRVGATVIDEKGRQFHGCNVENASYGATICAERNAILQAVAQGAKKIRDVIVVTQTSPPAEPCALCLQVIAEFSTPETRIWLGDLKNLQEVTGFELLLPRYFGPRSLRAGRA